MATAKKKVTKKKVANKKTATKKVAARKRAAKKTVEVTESLEVPTREAHEKETSELKEEIKTLKGKCFDLQMQNERLSDELRDANSHVDFVLQRENEALLKQEVYKEMFSLTYPNSAKLIEDKVTARLKASAKNEKAAKKS